jgi:hypothetical protein
MCRRVDKRSQETLVAAGAIEAIATIIPCEKTEVATILGVDFPAGGFFELAD